MADKMEGYRAVPCQMQCHHIQEKGGGVSAGPGLTMVTGVFPTLCTALQNTRGSLGPQPLKLSRGRVGRAGTLQPHSVQRNDESRSLKHI